MLTVLVVIAFIVGLAYLKPWVKHRKVSETYDLFTDFFEAFRTDVTGAWYGGDYSLTLQQAQQQKYDKILEFLEFKAGDVVLDIGCGWGYLLEEVHRRGGKGIGLTLSPRQAEAGRRKGLDIRVMNWKDVDPAKFPKITHIVSVGAFEHFATLEEAYKQEMLDITVVNGDSKVTYAELGQSRVYQRYFKLCHDLLPPGGKMYLQTMVFTPRGDEIAQRLTFDIDSALKWSSPNSDDHIMALLSFFYPESALPKGFEQIAAMSARYFNITTHNSGRRDYIVTLNEWAKLGEKRSWGRTLALYAKYLPLVLTDRQMWYTWQSFRHCAQAEVFKRSLFEHERIFMTKK